jgi:hypothetical protein
LYQPVKKKYESNDQQNIEKYPDDAAAKEPAVGAERKV